MRRVVPFLAMALLCATGCGLENPVSVPESLELNLSATTDDAWVITAYYWNDGWVELTSWDGSYLPDDLKIQLIAWNDDYTSEYQADFDNLYAFGDLDLPQGLIDDFNDGVIAPIWNIASPGGEVYEDDGVLNIDIPSSSEPPSGDHHVALAETGYVVHREFDVQVDFALSPGFHSLSSGPTAGFFVLHEDGIRAHAEVSVGIGQYQVSGPVGLVHDTETDDVTGKLRLTRTRAVLEVNIDIKPGSDPNSINLGSNGTVPVAILSTPDFDATTVDPLSVTLADADVKVKGNGTAMASEQDVNQDGLMDLVVHVSTSGLTLTDGDVEAVLKGETFGGQRIQGFDSVRIVP